ncbi:MAG: prepilin-type N-terminal cleavage/methylation domain-containing protein, partial [Elusimicrobia bacterium]|nr:prepilin-type N-terminal cleavage/methylation domain-containing protein [Elusimicrobiota bacterium]
MFPRRRIKAAVVERIASTARAGFTLIELVVVVTIIGALAAFGIPQYLNTVETNKAEDAAALVNAIGSSNKLFSLDHANEYTYGPFVVSGANRCVPGGACPTAPPYNNCALIYCKYLPDQDFLSKAYLFSACHPTTGQGSVACATTLTASAR